MISAEASSSATRNHGQVALHGRVELDLPRLDELHDRQRGERLAERADDEGRLRGHGPPGVVRLAEAAEVGDPVVLDDAERESGDPLCRHLVLNEALDGRELRSGSWPVGSRSVGARPAREVGRPEYQRGEDHPHAGLPTD